jgi:single-strand DNA-binding protein
MTNIVIVTSRLTADPELKITGENKLCKLRIAVERPKKKGAEKSETDFFNCTAWNHNAEFISDMFSKGEMITVVGNLRSSTFEKNGEKRTSVEIKVNEVHFPGYRRKFEDNGNSNTAENDGYYDINDSGVLF